jgi:hypothetical protein
MGCLNWFWLQPDGVEVNKPAVELCLLLSPDLLHGQDLLGHPGPALRWLDAMVLHLFEEPSGGDTERKSPG